MQHLNLFDWEKSANESLTELAWDYYRSGSRDEITLRDSHTIFERIRLRFRVLAGVADIHTSTTVLGHEIALPVLVAPTAFHKLAAPEGEVATARGTGEAGTIFTLSTLSNTPVEEVCAATDAPVFFQLYVYKDRGATRALVDRAREAGVDALVLTVDAPVLGTRERDVRNRFRLPPGLEMPNAVAEPYRKIHASDRDSALAVWVAENLDSGLTWKDVDWLRNISELPVVVKGVVRGDDASLAVDHGASAVVVSNHGGRQLDTSITSIEALPDVCDGVDGHCEVWLDGGIRRGTDIVKAIALGARVVLIGRPALWGLAVAGSDGVRQVLQILHDELEQAMALCGTATLDELDRDFVVR